LTIRTERTHEASIDLQDVDREVSEIGQRRVPGPEIVDRDAHTELSERLQLPLRLIGVGHHDPHGDLEHEQPSCEP
jgi:hypothetical protein